MKWSPVRTPPSRSTMPTSPRRQLPTGKRRTAARCVGTGRRGAAGMPAGLVLVCDEDGGTRRKLQPRRGMRELTAGSPCTIRFAPSDPGSTCAMPSSPARAAHSSADTIVTSRVLAIQRYSRGLQERAALLLAPASRRRVLARWGRGAAACSRGLTLDGYLERSSKRSGRHGRSRTHSQRG